MSELVCESNFTLNKQFQNLGSSFSQNGTSGWKRQLWILHLKNSLGAIFDLY